MELEVDDSVALHEEDGLLQREKFLAHLLHVFLQQPGFFHNDVEFVGQSYVLL